MVSLLVFYLTCSLSAIKRALPCRCHVQSPLHTALPPLRFLWLRLSTTRAAQYERVDSHSPPSPPNYSVCPSGSTALHNFLLLCSGDLRGAWAADVRERWVDKTACLQPNPFACSSSVPLRPTNVSQQCSLPLLHVRILSLPTLPVLSTASSLGNTHRRHSPCYRCAIFALMTGLITHHHSSSRLPTLAFEQELPPRAAPLLALPFMGPHSPPSDTSVQPRPRLLSMPHASTYPCSKQATSNAQLRVRTCSFASSSESHRTQPFPCTLPESLLLTLGLLKLSGHCAFASVQASQHPTVRAPLTVVSGNRHNRYILQLSPKGSGMPSCSSRLP